MSWVFKGWIGDLPWKMQSVLMTATRGPDQARDLHIKMANRWLRSMLFNDADPANPFIVKPGDLPPSQVLDELEHALEYVNVHYFGHFIHAFQIIGAMHPDDDVQIEAWTVYVSLCQRILHLPPESPDLLRQRLSDVTVHA